MKAIRDIGGFDQKYFLYYEDDDMCLSMRRHGWKLLLVPDAVVTHIGGGSVRVDQYYHWRKFWNIACSRLYIEKKYNGKLAMLRLAIASITKFSLKGLGYFIIFQKEKACRDFAKAAGAIAALLGRRASKWPRARPILRERRESRNLVAYRKNIQRARHQ